ncbi:MAG TPA: AzlC family ABC transporter permease [Solirubrobacteraceae bacterium]|nr:AzlC family ABC transporter permease [Solirubrobacteraceae bacterium]
MSFGPSLRVGVRAGVPYGIAGFALSFSFGVVARPVMGPIAPIVMSVIVFAGSAQFAALAVISAGGSPVAAIVAGALLNLRFVPMGIAIAPWLRENAFGRAIRAQAIVDASWAMSHQGEGRYDPDFLLGATIAQYPMWVLGTVAGVLIGPSLDAKALGLDAILPTFFFGLLIAELGKPHAKLVAALGAVVAAVLIPLTPAGIPIVAASLVALVGLRR